LDPRNKKKKVIRKAKEAIPEFFRTIEPKIAKIIKRVEVDGRSPPLCSCCDIPCNYHEHESMEERQASKYERPYF